MAKKRSENVAAFLKLRFPYAPKFPAGSSERLDDGRYRVHPGFVDVSLSPEATAQFSYTGGRAVDKATLAAACTSRVRPKVKRLTVAERKAEVHKHFLRQKFQKFAGRAYGHERNTKYLAAADVRAGHPPGLVAQFRYDGRSRDDKAVLASVLHRGELAVAA